MARGEYRASGGDSVNVLFQILMMIIQALPWGELFKLAMGLINKQAPEVESGAKTGAQAEAENLAVMETATSMSPGLSTTPLKFIHTLAYMFFIHTHDKSKFDRWNDELAKWQASIGSKSYDDPEIDTVYDRKFSYMQLYTSKPDKQEK